MLAGLENDKLDVVLTVGQERATHGLQWTPLVRAPFQLTVHRNHPLARRQRVTPAEATRERLLAFCQRDYPEYRDMLTSWLREHRQQLRIAAEYDGVDSLLAAVESGLGVAIVATRKGRPVPERVRLKAPFPAPPLLCIAVGCRADRAEARLLAMFIEELSNAAQVSA